MGNVSISVGVNPFHLGIYSNNERVMSANTNDLLQFEQRRVKICRKNKVNHEEGV